MRVALLLIGIVLAAVSARAQDVSALEDRIRVLETRLNELEQRFPVQEVGAVTMRIAAGKATARTTVQFRQPQSSHAIVLTGETGWGGTHLLTKAERITRNTFDIIICNVAAKPLGKPYNARIGYVVIRGEGTPEAH